MTGAAADLTHVHQMWANDSASAELGIELIDVGVGVDVGVVKDGGVTTAQGQPRPLGHARTRMTVTSAMVNGHGIMHGGYLFTLADSTFALACNATGQLTVAASGDISFLLPCRLGDELVATAQERVVHGRSGITDVTVCRTGDNEIVAEFRGRSRALPR